MKKKFITLRKIFLRLFLASILVQATAPNSHSQIFGCILDSCDVRYYGDGSCDVFAVCLDPEFLGCDFLYVFCFFGTGTIDCVCFCDFSTHCAYAIEVREDSVITQQRCCR